jgi:hypothetical protein
MGMTEQNIYQLGTHTHKRIDSRGREEEWTWEITPEAVIALQAYHLKQN